MKKAFTILLAVSMVMLTACKSEENSSKVKTLEANTPESSQVDESISKPEKTEVEVNALKVISADFTDAMTIETKRQNVLINGCSADKDNATSDAFKEMKALYKTLCTKVENELNDDQKALFKDYLAKEKEYNIAFDMFSHNALQQYVYTTGNASCSEAYNIMRTKAVIMYGYFNFLTEKNTDNANFTGVLNENYNSFFFFNSKADEVRGKSETDINKIDSRISPLLKNIFKADSQPVFDTYKKSAKDYMSALKAFEKSIDNTGKEIDNSAFYNSLNTNFINKLYNTIKAEKYPDDIKKLFNLNADKDDYISKWN